MRTRNRKPKHRRGPRTQRPSRFLAELRGLELAPRTLAVLLGTSARSCRRWLDGEAPGSMAQAFVQVLALVATKLDLSHLASGRAELLPEAEDEIRADLEACEAEISARARVTGSPSLQEELGRGAAPEPPAHEVPRPRTYTAPTACEAAPVKELKVEQGPGPDSAPAVPARAPSCPYGAPLLVRSSKQPAIRPETLLAGERPIR